MNEVFVDRLRVQIYNDRREIGEAAAKQAALTIRQILQEKTYVNIIFAAAASQNEFLDVLSKDHTIDWKRVNAFHMDEYIGLPKDHKQRFANYLKRKIFDKQPFHAVYYLNESDQGTESEITRYAKLLQQHPPDITCMGIGENTHLAFNDPHVADFEDPQSVKVVDIDEPCKQQQVNEGCFEAIEEVPSFAYTLTIPVLVKAKYIFCMVPGLSKAVAIGKTLFGEINERHPSSILRKHENAILYLDRESAKEYLQKQMIVADQQF